VKEEIMNAKLAVRSIVQAVVYLIGALSALGVDVPVVDQSILTKVVTIIVAIIILSYNTWKNFSVTPEAKTADNLMRAMKATADSFGGEADEADDEASHEENDPEDAEEEEEK
jgi:hypothetical protein